MFYSKANLTNLFTIIFKSNSQRHRFINEQLDEAQLLIYNLFDNKERFKNYLIQSTFGSLAAGSSSSAHQATNSMSNNNLSLNQLNQANSAKNNNNNNNNKGNNTNKFKTKKKLANNNNNTNANSKVKIELTSK
jgi:hypothetical protein